MRADERVRCLLEKSIDQMHSARAKVLVAAVAAVIKGGKLPLAQLGRAISSRSTAKHGIKRVDRFLGNEKIHGSIDAIQRDLTQRLLGQNRSPIILVDWTDKDKDGLCVLCAALPVNGRAVPLLWEAHPKKRLGNRHVERRFLRRLKHILPEDASPILVTDAGFKNPWFRSVSTMGWDFVGRLRGSTQVYRKERWWKLGEIFSLAKLHATDLGACLLTQYQPFLARLVTVRLRRKKSVQVRSRKECAKDRARRSASEPWVLATSLSADAAKIVGIYRKRMQIEETFRDLKSHRFGWSFEQTRTSSTKRLEMLLLIATLASLTVLLVGMAAESEGLHRAFQANTIRSRRVLSWVTLGRLVLATAGPKKPLTIPALASLGAYLVNN